MSDTIGDVYSKLTDKKKHIKKVLETEEVSFGKTLDRGLLLIIVKFLFGTSLEPPRIQMVHKMLLKFYSLLFYQLISLKN